MVGVAVVGPVNATGLSTTDSAAEVAVGVRPSVPARYVVPARCAAFGGASPTARTPAATPA
ncbi:hypothetical protein [Plantactinospora sp. GCM10030261]|uniref:hypothetical protein n=1 Tax=Plantactinospora sp. GCM10030261 TaxID=3273420 RepID=UPI00361EEAC4